MRGSASASTCVWSAMRPLAWIPLVVWFLPATAWAQFIVTSSERGVLELSPDGTSVEVLSATPAARGRTRGSGHVVFLVAQQNELRDLDLTTGAEHVVATLPSDAGLGCGGIFGSPTHEGAPYLVADHLEFEASMAVDEARACFEVMDRNVNMASVIVQLEVRLEDGAVTQHVIFSEHCGSLDDDARQALPCTPILTRAAREPPPGRSTRPLPRTLPIVEARTESSSPDGRWSLVSGNPEEGDYLYRRLYLFDGRRRALYSLLLASDASAWPARIAGDVGAEALESMGVLATGETAVVWIDEGRGLVIGGSLLVRPGRSLQRLPGALVR